MNVLLWVLQGLLALLCLAGGAYKLSQPGQLATQVGAGSPGAWRMLGVLEIICGVLLIVPAAAGWLPVLTPLAAAVLALETLGLSALYARRSVKPAAANPLVWSAAMALMAMVVVAGRWA